MLSAQPTSVPAPVYTAGKQGYAPSNTGYATTTTTTAPGMMSTTTTTAPGTYGVTPTTAGYNPLLKLSWWFFVDCLILLLIPYLIQSGCMMRRAEGNITACERLDKLFFPPAVIGAIFALVGTFIALMTIFKPIHHEYNISRVPHIAVFALLASFIFTFIAIAVSNQLEITSLSSALGRADTSARVVFAMLIIAGAILLFGMIATSATGRRMAEGKGIIPVMLLLLSVFLVFVAENLVTAGCGLPGRSCALDNAAKGRLALEILGAVLCIVGIFSCLGAIGRRAHHTHPRMMLTSILLTFTFMFCFFIAHAVLDGKRVRDNIPNNHAWRTVFAFVLLSGLALTGAWIWSTLDILTHGRTWIDVPYKTHTAARNNPYHTTATTTTY